MFWSAPRSPTLVLPRDNSSDKMNYAKKKKVREKKIENKAFNKTCK
jgi:hypothetical protein